MNHVSDQLSILYSDLTLIWDELGLTKEEKEDEINKFVHERIAPFIDSYKVIQQQKLENKRSKNAALSQKISKLKSRLNWDICPLLISKLISSSNLTLEPDTSVALNDQSLVSAYANPLDYNEVSIIKENIDELSKEVKLEAVKSDLLNESFLRLKLLSHLSIKEKSLAKFKQYYHAHSNNSMLFNQLTHSIEPSTSDTLLPQPELSDIERLSIDQDLSFTRLFTISSQLLVSYEDFHKEQLNELHLHITSIIDIGNQIAMSYRQLNRESETGTMSQSVDMDSQGIIAKFIPDFNYKLQYFYKGFQCISHEEFFNQIVSTGTTLHKDQIFQDSAVSSDHSSVFSKLYQSYFDTHLTTYKHEVSKLPNEHISISPTEESHLYALKCLIENLVSIRHFHIDFTTQVISSVNSTRNSTPCVTPDKAMISPEDTNILDNGFSPFDESLMQDNHCTKENTHALLNEAYPNKMQKVVTSKKTAYTIDDVLKALCYPLPPIYIHYFNNAKNLLYNQLFELHQGILKPLIVRNLELHDQLRHLLVIKPIPSNSQLTSETTANLNLLIDLPDWDMLLFTKPHPATPKDYVLRCTDLQSRLAFNTKWCQDRLRLAQSIVAKYTKLKQYIQQWDEINTEHSKTTVNLQDRKVNMANILLSRRRRSKRLT